MYTSKRPFPKHRVGALAVYCSDGRYNSAFDEFVEEKLRLPNYDRLSVPGGPAWLIHDMRRFQESSIARSYVEFLVNHHQLKRIILLAHENCGFYLKKMGCTSAADVQGAQLEDLRRAKDSLRLWHREVTIEAYLASVDHEKVAFRPA